MNGFLLRLVITALGLWLASELVTGVSITGMWTLIFAALLLGIVNAVIRPIALVLTFPFTLITLGLFILVVNAAMFALVAALLDGFRLSGFWAALMGAIVVSVTSWLASAFIGPRGRYEVIVIHKRS
jgi:putative membrane protein